LCWGECIEGPVVSKEGGFCSELRIRLEDAGTAAVFITEPEPAMGIAVGEGAFVVMGGVATAEP
jgi:hypothetical protein